MDLGPFGFTEILFIGLLALVVFGPRRLPEIGQAAGRAVARLKRATHELRAAYEAEIDEESRRELDSARQALREVKGTIDSAGREIFTQGSRTASQVKAAADDLRREISPSSRSAKPGEGADPPGEGADPPGPTNPRDAP